MMSVILSNKKPSDNHHERLNYIADGLRMFADKWMLIIIESLREGSMRFSDIENTTGINTRTLTNRLKKLEFINLITKQKAETDKREFYYQLTEKGKEVIGILNIIIEFTKKYF